MAPVVAAALAASCLMWMSASAHAQKFMEMAPDARAPAGVMWDHTAGHGALMASYKYARMTMRGNRDGTDDLSTAEVLAQYMVAPSEMTMDMHMFGLMYGATDRMTLSVMVPYIRKSMDHLTRSGIRFKTDSEGLGDVRLTALYNVLSRDKDRLHLSLGLSIPTGSINERDDIPAGSNRRLPYPMQIGSGTVDILPGITYRMQAAPWSWGAQALATIRLDENDHDYTLGNAVSATGWVARRFDHALSGSLRLKAEKWGNIDGADDALNPLMVPTADPDRRGGRQVTLFAGLNARLPDGFLKMSRLAIELGVPVYQNLDGPQLETDWSVSASLSSAF